VQCGGDLTGTAVGRRHHPVIGQHRPAAEVCRTKGPIP
jgi:hypothetical protein